VNSTGVGELGGEAGETGAQLLKRTVRKINATKTDTIGFSIISYPNGVILPGMG